MQVYVLFARYWGELWPDSPTYPRIVQSSLYRYIVYKMKNKVLPPYVNFPSHKAAHFFLNYSDFVQVTLLVIAEKLKNFQSYI